MTEIPKKSRWQRIKEEIVEIWILTVYLAIFFSAISYLRFAILQHAGITDSEFWMNAIKAAVCAKFMMISRAVYPLKIHPLRPLVWHILGRSLAYVLMVTVLIGIEEGIMAKIHGKHLAAGITGLEPGSINMFFALVLLYWLMVIPYITYSAIAQALGENRLRKLVFGYGGK